ncbi:anhydro-N-acetylmuramic acid kinase [Mucilaginibacter sp. CSA2-8R]|uniref:anhydro-N-acetylmuramic acid kinase n=2 Tax=Mucilaginibacter sp. CSA2-8R TaxID=3141542 RepID=UPI00315CC876
MNRPVGLPVRYGIIRSLLSLLIFMNVNIQKLYTIAAKPVRTIIGLMSGTSFDGLDIALCQFTGSGPGAPVSIQNFITKEYTPQFKEEIKSVFVSRQADLEKVTVLNAYIGTYYAELINECLADWGLTADDVDLIASHGQTIFHAPKHLHPDDHYDNATLQIGDADHLSVKTGIITLSDFRQKHIAGGGEGAPLAVYGDYLIFSDPHESRVLLNIGGIANFTYLPAGQPAGFFSTDVGPGNTLMDQYVQLHYPGRYYDKDSALASQGQVNEVLLKELLKNDFFEAPFPKTTGPELFNLAYLNRALSNTAQTGLSHHDVLATLAAFSARGIIKAIEATVGSGSNFEIYVSGGGMYNPLLLSHLQKHFGKTIRSTNVFGVNPDAKEAVLFALLANEAVAGSPDSLSAAAGIPRVSMGKVSFPL